MISIFDQYKFCPNCAGKLVNKVEYKHCNSCNQSFFFNPKPTVSCILVNENEEYLLIKRAIEPFKDWWDLPGGFVDPNENIETAAIREVKEETGLDVSSGKFLFSEIEDYDYQGVRMQVVGSFFVFEFKSSQKIIAGDDAYDYALFKAQELPFEDIAFTNQRKLFKQFVQQMR